MEDELTRLQAWYAAHCDGEWEHTNGIRIDTLDNPGWSVVVDLAGTGLAGIPLPERSEDDGEGRWLHVAVRERRFKGHGGPAMLPRLVSTFLDWADANR